MEMDSGLIVTHFMHLAVRYYLDCHMLKSKVIVYFSVPLYKSLMSIAFIVD
jgi:hypothetical protein